MRVELTGRHVDITPALRRLVDRKLARLERVLNDSALSAQVVLTDEKRGRRADVTLHARGEKFLHGDGAVRRLGNLVDPGVRQDRQAGAEGQREVAGVEAPGREGRAGRGRRARGRPSICRPAAPPPVCACHASFARRGRRSSRCRWPTPRARSTRTATASSCSGTSRRPRSACSTGATNGELVLVGRGTLTSIADSSATLDERRPLR